jgi:hypothetical protein
VRSRRAPGFGSSTDSEEIIRRREILSGYFPETVEIESARYPRLEQIAIWAVLAENAHRFESPSLRMDNPVGLFGLIGSSLSG